MDAGITLFDTAENYPTPAGPETQGRSEELLGRWIADRDLRGQVLIATKVAGPGNAASDMRHIRGEARRLDRANIRQAVEDSLRRLGADFIDLYQVHWAERAITTLERARFSLVSDREDSITLEATLEVLGKLVREGNTRAIGACDESPWGVMRYVGASERDSLSRIASVQNSYNLLDRQFKLGLAEGAMREQIGLIAYSPLAGGRLTGQYGASPTPIAGSRSSQSAGFLARLSRAKLGCDPVLLRDCARSRPSTLTPCPCARSSAAVRYFRPDGCKLRRSIRRQHGGDRRRAAQRGNTGGQSSRLCAQQDAERRNFAVSFQAKEPTPNANRLTPRLHRFSDKSATKGKCDD